MPSSREQILANADALTERPEAIEALWDGDSGDWTIYLVAVLKTEGGYRDNVLGTLRDGSTLFRLLGGEVPPWPEAVRAGEIGCELADRFGAPFYFPSPAHPEDDCPRWWEQDLGSPCRRCGIPLLQIGPPPIPWKGACYRCHLDEEREAKESRWTAEERAGPRCRICGNPAKGTLDGAPMCPACLDCYTSFNCSRCGGYTLIPKAKFLSDVCRPCELRERIDSTPPDYRRAIVDAYTKDGLIVAIKRLRELMGWSLLDAKDAIFLLDNPNDPAPG